MKETQKEKVRVPTGGNPRPTGAGVGLPGGLGFLAGLLLTVIFVRSGWSPGWLAPVNQIQDAMHGMAGSLAADPTDLGQVQREVANALQRDPGLYLRVDNALGMLLTREVIRERFLSRDVSILKPTLEKLSELETAAAYAQELRQRVPVIMRKLARDFGERWPALYRYLQRRYPGADDLELLRHVEADPTARVLLSPASTAPIVFIVPTPSAVTISIESAGAASFPFLKTDLPAGDYRMHWNYRDGGGQRLDCQRDCAFHVHLNGRPYASGPIPPRTALPR